MFIFHNIFHGLFMILIKKYKVRLFIILTHFKDGIWYKQSFKHNYL